MSDFQTSDAPPISRPLPTGKVFLSARWLGLAMINYEIDPQLVEPLVPRGVELDFHEGKTFVSLVGFLFHDTRVLGVAVPWHRHFAEVNLRFYVRRVLGSEVRRGVGFVREIVPQRAIATVARLGYNEPYVATAMKHAWTNLAIEPQGVVGESPTATYDWQHAGGWLSIGARCRGAAAPLTPGSPAEFIAEHYWGYCRQRNGGTVEYRVEHPPWNVWHDAEPIVGPGVADYYPAPFAEVLHRSANSAFLAAGSAVRVYQPTRIC